MNNDVQARLAEIRDRYDRYDTIGSINAEEELYRLAGHDVPYLLSLVERYQKALLDWDQDVCWCGHPRIDHAAHDASPRCFIDGCDCEGYTALRDAAQEGAE